MHQTMRQSSFYAAVRRNGWANPRSGAPLSNVLMDGGCIYVPDAEYKTFLELCARCTDDGEPLYVVERPSTQLRFYADIDAHLPMDADVDGFVDGLAALFARRAAAHLDSASPTIVLCAEVKRLDAGHQKVGVHLVMPQTRVADADAVRRKVLADLEASALLAPPALLAPLNGWADAFDSSVYTQGGLRLVGCRKMVPCGCAGEACAHPGRKVDAGRPYLFRTVLDCHGVVDETWTRTLRANAVVRTVMCSIRTPEDEAAPRKPQRPKRPRAPGAAASDAASMRLVDLVDGEVDAVHRTLSVVGVIGSLTGGERKLLRVEGQGSQYCPNVGRSHRQSSIYFVVGADGVAMRCRCKKGTCPSFRSPVLPLTAQGARFVGFQVSERGLPPGFL